jgi:pimeloyl-ACP methyl ester carboxylesterase
MTATLSATALVTALWLVPAGPAAAQPDSTWQVEEVAFEAANGVVLAGLVYIPTGDGPFTGAVLIQGSGSSDRTNLWARTFAETLARAGVATLLPDKRGSGASGGDWMTASFEVLARDALAGVARLREHAAVKVDDVGIVGLSQGGFVAPLAAALGEVAWVVDVSGAAVTLAEQIRHEMANTAREAGLSPEGVAAVLEIQRLAEGYVETGDWEPYAAALEAAAGEPWAEIAAGFPDTPDAPIWDWIRLNASYDPIPHWKAVEVPVLVVYGAEDEEDNLPVEESVKRLKQAFAESDTDDHVIQIFLDAGHALWAPDATQENLKLHPDLVELLERWIHGRTRLPSARLPDAGRGAGRGSSSWEQLFQDEAGLREKTLVVEVAPHDRERVLHRRDIEVPQQIPHVIQVVELLAQPHRSALHRQEVFGPRHEDFQVGQIEEVIKVAARTEIPLHRVVQPGIRDAFLRSNARRRLSHDTGRPEQGVDVACRIAGVEGQAHDRPAYQVQFPLDLLRGELRSEQLEQPPDVGLRELRPRGHQTRSPSAESTKMFRRLNATGEARTR